jgi:predicted small lipoprotein YifL
MADVPVRRFALLFLSLTLVAGCGKKGPLYLPEAASEVVTRPAETPPASESTEAPNSPQTVDSQPTAPAPAPEVSAEETKKGAPKKDAGATPPPHQ